MYKRLFIISLLIKLSIALSAQCPDRAYLYHRIVWLRDSSQVNPSDQLQELQGYLTKIRDCPYQNDSTHAMLIARIGWLLSTQTDFSQAIAITIRAIDMIHQRQTKSDINESHLIKYYNNLKILYDSTDQEKLKIEAIDSCIAVAVRLQTGLYYAMQNLDWKVRYLYEKGDYYDCINLASLGENICRKTGYNSRYVAFYIILKINALLTMKYSKEADQLTDKTIQECFRTKNEYYIGSLYNLKADIAESSGNAAEALRLMQLSLFYNKKIGLSSGYATSWNNLGYKLYFLNLHQYDKAIAACKQALKYVEDDEVVEILNNIANSYIKKGDFKQAFDFFRQSFNKIKPGTNETNFLDIPVEEMPGRVRAESLITLLLDNAYAYLTKFKQQHDEADIQHALVIYKMADRYMDKLKISQTELSSKLFWRNSTRRLYEQAIESCHLSSNPDDAFYFFEKSRAVLLIDQLRQQQIGDKDIGQMATIRKNILRLERSMNDQNPGSEKYADYQRKLFASKQELNRIDQLVRVQNPWYYQSMVDTSFIGLPAVQRQVLLRKDVGAILEFFQGDSAVYLLTVKKNQSLISRINKNEFEDKVDRFSAYLGNPALENQDFKGFISCSHELYELIFSSTSATPGRIIISPDGRYFPFEALVTNINITNPVYYIDDHVVSYTYSVRYLLNDFSNISTVATGNFLGLAPVQFLPALNLTTLTRSGASLEKIGSLYTDSRTLLGSKASRNNFMRLFNGYKIIQLYTHASDSSSTGEPVIYFADSAVYLSELIPEKKTSTQLIVLSACETGNGKSYKGEGIFSFNRGFAAMGIPSSVINLWSVENESTYSISELFYTYVSQGISLDSALQKAKLDFIRSSSRGKKLPFYWAAPVIVGKTDAVYISRKTNLTLFYLVFGLLITALVIFNLFGRKNKHS